MCMKLDLTMTYIQLNSGFLTIKQIGDRFFFKYLISTYLLYSKEYCHKCYNFCCPNLTTLTKYLGFISKLKQS